MDERTVTRDKMFGRLPPTPKTNLAAALQALIRSSGRKVIVLDDDPTGTQTVHDIPVVTQWTVEHLARELNDTSPVSYVLTNSRSLPVSEAISLNRTIAENLRIARSQTDRDFTLVSRSDSTLRGHFPDELEALTAGVQESFDSWVICPFFEEGGRFTIDDVHYVGEGLHLIPAAQTPFAADPAFGYRNSNLRHWIVEKTKGRISLKRIASLQLDELRSLDREPVRDKLRSLTAGSACIINAVTQTDLESAVAALLEVEAEGKRFLYRTAASFVATRSGIEPRPLLSRDEICPERGGGTLVVAGSYVPKTTAQLEHLLTHGSVLALELDVRRVLDESTRGAVVADLAQCASQYLLEDATVVVYTSREVIEAEGDRSLQVGKTVSEALVDVVRAITVRPRVLIAKGGITSSDVATKACEVERAIVLGQVLPGVPVWRCGPESRFPDLSLVVFPGNVGGTSALCDVVDACCERH